ncbi:unnamed protein product [Paramecium pentaurelia]|uniref:Uncharacterized protein n=1 Tax=Paramecium pentaurelia TaxID=43138 RepID=A0A8S1XQD7_9CILI|nr:unnamed protein product [Paramecium pentaurelia]
MNLDSLPKGGVNKGMVLPLIFQCPQDCICQSSLPKIWYHKKCGQPSFISEYGDIFCCNHLEDCSGYFIQNAYFQCRKAKKSNTWYQHNQFSKLLMALSQAISVAENTLEANNVHHFTKNLLKSLHQRWHN